MKRENRLDDIIAAISTPIGTGGIGIVRMSGAGCIALADTLFRGKKPLGEKPSHTLSYGKIINGADGRIIDEVLDLYKRGYCRNQLPRRAAGDAPCAGSTACGRRAPCRAGRIYKTQLFERQDRFDAGRGSDRFDSFQNGAFPPVRRRPAGRTAEEILDMVAAIEAAIDYPDYDIEEETYSSMEQGTQGLLTRVEDLLKNADRGKIIREGVQTVIIGKPNVGKSSLLNWLLEEDRAIVTDIPGTTRDTVEEYLNIGGIPVKIVDTAGIRETADAAERIGVEKSRTYAEAADLIIMMLDSSRPLEDEDREILSFIREKKTVVLLNKTDLEQRLSVTELEGFVPGKRILPISVKRNEGFEHLLDTLKEMFLEGNGTAQENSLLVNTRHKDALLRAKAALAHCMETIQNRMPEDFISMDLQDANIALGEITGDTSDEEIIDRIFTKFCLGK